MNTSPKTFLFPKFELQVYAFGVVATQRNRVKPVMWHVTNVVREILGITKEQMDTNTINVNAVEARLEDPTVVKQVKKAVG